MSVKQTNRFVMVMVLVMLIIMVQHTVHVMQDLLAPIVKRTLMSVLDQLPHVMMSLLHV